ncbi:MAG: hypothetical protein DHS20C05_12960 [Hyphococcus sp.]|nr:MAG: hypothetical protein DHS20C05_12960 [Marinicaulis sp.]
MTIICAIYDSTAREVWLGCNDRSTIGDTPSPGVSSKWLKFGDWAIGLTGDESVYNEYLMLANDNFPKQSSNVLDVFKFLHSTYHEFNLGQQRGSDTSNSYGLDGILAHTSGRVWDFDNQLALSEIPENKLWACGSGVDYALGADFSICNTLSARERIEWAIKAAIALDIGCPGDPCIEKFVGQK